MVIRTFTDNQIKHFRVNAIISDVIADGLRAYFVRKWNDEYGVKYREWDDSKLVRQQFAILENKPLEPLTPPIREWDPTALFAAILRSKCFQVEDPRDGKFKSLSKLYVPMLPDGTFHTDYIKRGEPDLKVEAIAVDQLRLLRNRVFHSTSTQMIGDTEYTNYIDLVKETFNALKLDVSPVDQISSMPLESRLPSNEVEKLHWRYEKDRKDYLDLLEKRQDLSKGDIGANAEIASRQRAGTLPPISGSFFGRDDLLDTITKQLCSREDVVISGPPGIGKTKLVIRAGYRLKEKGVTVYFATFQEFIYEELASQGISRSDSKKKVLSAICSVVLDSIGLNQHKTEEAEMTLNNWLHMCSNPHVLIMDNVESMLVANIKEQFFDLLSRLTKCEHLRLCFTSREKFQITELGTTECIVPPLDIENSIQLVKHCTRLGKLEESELTNEQAKELSMTCCCLPLALRIACALVNENKVHATFYQTLELLKKSNPDRMKHFRSDKWKQTSMVLERSIEVSYLRFTPTLKETAVALSVFPDEFDAKAASHVLNVPDLDKCRAFYLLPLMHRSFLGYNEKTKRYSFHPFIREFLVISARKERQTFENAQIRYLEYFLEYFQDAAKIYRSSFPDGAKPAMKLFSLEKANIQTTFEFMCSNPETISQELATKYSHALQFPTFARTRLHLELCQRASKVCARLTHRYGMHADALFHYGVEGSYYGYYAKYSDFPKIKRITDEILERADTEEDKGKKALAITSLALAYLANTTSTENIIRCLYFSFRALELCRKTFGDHFVTMLAHFIVGGIYGYSYIPHKAMDHFREALRIARDALQLGDHPEVTSILAHMGQNMALFARSESDLKQALSFFQEGKEILHRLNTSSHADLIRINYETGYILTKLHNFPEAEDVLRKAIDVGTRLLGDHRLVVWSFKYLTRLQRDMGELDKAIFYATKALEMAQRLDKQSGLTADSFVDLAELYGRIRDYDLCLENHLRSLQLDPSRNKRFVPKKDSFIAMRTLASMKNGLLNFAKNCLVTDSVVILLVSVVHGINSLLRLLLSKSESVTLPIRKEQSREYDDYNEPLYYRLEELKKLLDDREELNTEPTGTKKMIRACKHAAEVYKLWGCPMEEQNIAQRARDLSHDISENEIQPDIKTWLQTKGNADHVMHRGGWNLLLFGLLFGLMILVLSICFLR